MTARVGGGADPAGADEIAVFPLNTVLYPGGPLQLRIFEPRYLDMVSDCMRNERRFAVCLIRDGNEAGRAAAPHPIGTLARIVDWHRFDDGLLGIVAFGESRVRLRRTRVSAKQLVLASYEPLADEPPAGVQPRHSILVELATGLVERAASLYSHSPARFDDASWIGYRLAELLPLPLERKQYYLEIEDPIVRLDQIADVVRTMAEREP